VADHLRFRNNGLRAPLPHFIIMNICVKMAWKWGGTKTITCLDTMTVEEVAEQHGFTGISEMTPRFISRG
jgi:hypothetical protein